MRRKKENGSMLCAIRIYSLYLNGETNRLVPLQFFMMEFQHLMVFIWLKRTLRTWEPTPQFHQTHFGQSLLHHGSRAGFKLPPLHCVYSITATATRSPQQQIRKASVFARCQSTTQPFSTEQIEQIWSQIQIQHYNIQLFSGENTLCWCQIIFHLIA